MFNDDKLSCLLEKIIKYSTLKHDSYLEVFGNEISGLVLDMLDESKITEELKSKSNENLINYIKMNGSTTLLESLHF